jgi:hypothetical protein
MRDLDFRGQTGSRLREQSLATFATKAAAATFAQSCGWLRGDAMRAADRFFVFWVVGQSGNSEQIRLLTKDRSVVEVVHPGYW